MEHQRELKGTRKMKEMLANNKLTATEKMFLGMIALMVHFEDGEECRAENTYFAALFNMPQFRCSLIINQLKEKRYIDVKMSTDRLKTNQRVIRILERGKIKTGGV